MSPRASRWILWLTLLFTLPLPFFLVETGRVPVARLLQLGGTALALMAAEGTQGQIVTLAALVLGQAVLYAALLWMVARGTAAVLVRLAPRRLAATTLFVVAVALVLVVFLPVYRTPFRTRSLETGLLHVFE